jgi:hypothetical protein
VVEDGGGPAVSTGAGNVTLDLKQLLQQTSDRVGVGGRVADRLPADAAQITLLKSDELELAQDVVRYLKTLAIRRPLPVAAAGEPRPQLLRIRAFSASNSSSFRTPCALSSPSSLSFSMRLSPLEAGAAGSAYGAGS